MEPIEVVARFNQEGEATPLSFTWKGNEYRVDSTGRRWTEGEAQHILTMIPGGRIVELIFRRGNGRWYLKQIPGDYQVA